MTKIKSRVLFYSFVAGFLILSPIALFYAMGYKYDFIDNQFVKTGSIHIKTQTNATVFINDQEADQTSFLNNSFSRNRMLPEEYKIRVEKEDYNSWLKLALIEEGILTDFPSVFLVKKEPIINIEDESIVASKSFMEEDLSIDSGVIKAVADFLDISTKKIKKIGKQNKYFYVLSEYNRGGLFQVNNNLEEEEILDSGVKDFIFSHNKEKLAWFTRSEVWVMWLYDAPYQPYKLQGEKELIDRTSKIIRKVQWHETNDHLFVWSGNDIEFIELDGRGNRNIYTIYQASNIEDIIYSKNDKKLYIFLLDEVVSLEL